jgi:NADPH:quinone reductase-like Zn-dependent oxidoreductase
VKAIVLREFGPPEVLCYEEVSDPIPRAGEVRIRVGGATVNRVLDVSLRRGDESARNPVLPLIPGVDCAGTIDMVGPGVSRWKVGDRVAAAGVMPLEPCAEDGAGYTGPSGMMGIKRPGGFAALITVPAVALERLPDGIDFHAAAVAMRHCPTAWNLLVNVAQLKADEWVMVMGASGNLGSIGIQIAKHVIGAKVIAVAGSRARADAGLALGADAAIDYSTEDLLAQARRITGGRGVDVLYDNIANPATLAPAFLAVGAGGRVVTAGAHGGPNVPINFHHLYDNRITIKGMPGSRQSDRPACFQAVAEGKIRVQIAAVLPLAQAAEAHRMTEADPGMGKIVLDPMLAG